MPLLDVAAGSDSREEGGKNKALGEESSAGKPKQKKTGGNTAGAGNKPKKSLENLKKNQEMKGLLELMLKTQLRGEQRLRELEGAVYDTYVGKASDLFLNQVSEQTQAYQDKVKGNKEHNLGPPHTYAFLGFIAGLVKNHAAEIGKKNHETLGAFKEQAETLGWQEVAELVKVFKVSKVYEREHRRITIMLGPGMADTGKVIKDSLAQLGWQHKQGKAPPSHMERELQAYLDASG